MIRTTLLLGAAVMTAGCAAVFGAGQPDAEAELRRGLQALRTQDYAAARSILEPVFESTWEKRTGQHALMALTAAELDPRNPDRRLWAGAEMAGRLLAIEGAAPEDIPVAETLYLLAVELGANEEQLARSESARQAAVDAAARRPTSSVRSVPQRIGALESEKQALERRLADVQQTLRTRDRELASARQELERIKKTLKIQ